MSAPDPPSVSDPLSFANESEKFVDEDAATTTAASEFATEGLTELELCAQYCRGCVVSVQRHFHVRSLGEVCRRAMRAGEETFPLDLVEDLAQDDDGDVRQMVAEQLGVLAQALSETHTRQEDDVYTGLLCVAFLLVEDDVDGVVSAAETAVATVAALLTGDDARETLLAQIANLAQCEEEEIRVSGANIIGSLACTLGPDVSLTALAPLLITLSLDDQFQIRVAAARALAIVGAAMRNEDVEASLVPVFRQLARDDVWSVRVAVANTLTSMATCLTHGAFHELVENVFEPLANDVSYQVRFAALENLGPLISALGGERTSAALVDHFVSAARAESGKGAGGSGDGLQLSCAFNLPGVALALGRERWGEIREAHATLADSVQWRVRRTVSCSLHEVAKILGPELTEADLCSIFDDTLRDTDEVREGAVSHLSDFFTELPRHAIVARLPLITQIGDPDDGGPPKHGVVGNWRLRQTLAAQLAAVSRICGKRANEDFVLPLALRLLRDPAHAVRAIAVGCLGSVLLETCGGCFPTPRAGAAQDAVESVKRMAMNPGWAERQAFVTMCGAFACVLDPSVVIAELVPLLVMTATDAVPNVRRELASVIATLRTNRAYATLPDLRDTAARLKNDVDRDVAQTARGCAFEDRGRGGGTRALGSNQTQRSRPRGCDPPSGSRCELGVN